MTDPQGPSGPPEPSETPAIAPGNPEIPSTTDETPTQAWPSLSTPTAAAPPPAAPPAPAAPATPTAPWEPTDSLPANRVDRVAETGTFGASTARPGRGGRLRWVIALAGVLLVAAISVVIVSLVGGKPATSIAMGYMPASVMNYEEVRLDLPGDQRQKLASFLKPLPGFNDSSQFDTKLNELFDQLLSSATNGKIVWTRDIDPWFGGEFALGQWVPALAQGVPSDPGTLVVLTVKDRTKALAWISSVADADAFNHTTYGDADVLTPAAGNGSAILAINDKVLVAGSAAAVHAAIDSGGKGTWAENDDVKAALATVEKDYVMVGVTRVKELVGAAETLIAQQSPGTLDQTQIDETIVDMLPAWFANSARFENDALVATSVGPAGKVGYDTSNHVDGIVGHIPASTLLVASEHDVGPTLTALVAKFRALPETKDAFAQFDRAVSLLGGLDAVVGWWGDSAVVVSKLDDGTIGGGLVVKPRDAAAADRLLTSLKGFISLAGGSSATVRTTDHNGTPVTVIDFSASMGPGSGLPPGYKPEIAWASNADIAVVGYGEAFVDAVLDAGPGHSLADDARFKGLLDRVGKENIALTFVDIKAVRTLLEPLAQQTASPEAWTQYTQHIQPFLAPIDALIATGRKDGSNDRGVTVITTPR